MTKTKHTPGPWVVGRKLDYGQSILIDAENGEPSLHYSSWQGLAIVHGCDDSPIKGPEVAEANARLISAAPELLEALRELVKVVPIANETESQDRAKWKALAAITKAEGGE